jgi:aspartyl-tRNA synthetase
MYLRTHYCGLLNKDHIGEEVVICGWVDSIRDHGGVTFVDLRDREGVVQLVFLNQDVLEVSKKLKKEYVIRCYGRVRKRPEGTENPRLLSGEVEVVVDKVEILNTSSPLPFELSEYSKVSEELRLEYRYLDLRQQHLQHNLLIRHKTALLVRNYLSSRGFIEVETPFLTKSTPEGARDFLVPSRLSHGKFYALPQSPQLFKQILMCSGIEKYFQIVRCFRDEDLRADRQPEFTQIDIEMSFVDEEDVMALCENMMKTIFKEILDIDIEIPFPRIKYDEAINRYGTDKPDLRIQLEIADCSSVFRNTQFEVFRKALSRKNGTIRCIRIPGGSEKLSREEIEKYTVMIKQLGGEGLAWIKVEDNKFSSGIAKFISENEKDELYRLLNLSRGDIVFFSAGEHDMVCKLLSQLRSSIGEKYFLSTNSGKDYKFVWIVDFPLFEYSEEEKRWVSKHHPFTLPKNEHLSMLDEIIASGNNVNIGEIKSVAYDLVLNGEEVGGGSLRIYSPELQRKVFRILQLSDEEVDERFGFLLRALSYGAPPHGGIAIGFDRLIAMMCNEESIREVIAFPKTQKAVCPLTGAPASVNKRQLEELKLQVIQEKKS